MNNYDVKRLALVLAVQATIEGMKSENRLCEILGQRPLFNDEHFEDKASELKNLAYVHDEQL